MDWVKKICFGLPILLLFYTELQAQEVFQIPRIDQEPHLDGNLNEQVWETLQASSLFMLNPNDEAPPSEQSEFKIAFSDKYLYVAIYNFDTEAEKIQSTSKRRDEMALSNDWCGISLDTYLDKENALDFATTPAGLRLDMQIENDGDGDFPVNPDWNVVWDVETKITNEGWFAEFRIPLSSLRYQVIDGKVTMGLAIFRYIARKSEWSTYPKMSNEFGFWSWAKVSAFQKVELEDIKAINPLYFSPYVLAGFQQNFDLNEAETAYAEENTFQRNIGMDVKYGLAKNLTLDLTVNTDFAQVEADDQEVNLTRFSLFFPEKRQFFMERANVFNYQFGRDGHLFYSRTIGLYDGNQVPLWGGGRLTGRIGDWDIGAMSLQTAPFDEDGVRVLETSNHSVMRARRKLPLNKNSYAGVMVTSLIEKDGGTDLAYGLDAILNLAGNTYLDVKLAQSYDSDEDQGENHFDRSRYGISLSKRAFEGFSYVLHYDKAGKSYDPAMGFEFREDYRKLGHHTSWGIMAPEKSKLLRYSFGFHGDYFLRNEDNSLETMFIRPSFELVTKNSSDFSIRLQYEWDDVREEFDLSDDIVINPGEYKNIGVDANYSTSSEKPLHVETGIYSGTYYGGYRNSFSISPNYSHGNTWKFSGTYQFYRIDFNETNELYQTHLFRLKVWYMYSIKLSAYANVQYNSLTESFFLNAKIRYNHREGNDFYIVFNDGVNTNRMRKVPHLPFSDQRTVLLKYTHTFRVR